MSAGYGAKLWGQIGLRGSARGLQQARRIKKEAGDARTEAEKARKEVTFAYRDQLTMGLNILSTTQLTRFILQDMAALMDEDKRGLSNILSMATSIIILMYRMQQLQMDIAIQQQALMAGQKVGGVLGFVGGLGIGPAALVGGLIATTLAVGALEMIARSASDRNRETTGGISAGQQESITTAMNRLTTDRRMRALRYGGIVG